MKVEIDVSLKGDILDPEARAILESLALLGFGDLVGIRRRKVFECELNVSDLESARRQAEAMCEKLLVNRVTEDYQIRVL